MARQSMNCLEDLQVLDRSGVIMAGLSEPESEALEHDLACYQSMGWKADDFVPDEMQSQHSIGPGLVLTQAGSFDPGAALDRLTQQARLYGAQILHGIQAEDVVDTDGGIEIHCAQGRIQADIVIHTCGWSLVKWLPWAREKLYPVRLQHLCLETEELKLELPMMLQYGHSWARPLSSGLLTGGCRWATPHLEVGETDETRLSEPVEQRVMARAEALFEVPSTASISHRWAQIATYTCDGLPFVGALPGSARQVVCTGWNGRPWSMALAAGASVAAGITSEASVALPRCLSSYRMI
jgi:glycine/D-amino acid oxidase-like deaminating enzyme